MVRKISLVFFLVTVSICGIFGQSAALQQKVADVRNKNTPCTLEFLQEVAAEAKDYYDANDILFAIIASRKADIYESQNNYEAAIQELKNTIAILQKQSDDHANDIRGVYGRIVAIYDTKGDYQQAITEGKKLLADWEKQASNDRGNISNVENRVGMVYYDLGNYDEAISYYNKALTDAKKAYGEKSYDVAAIYNNLGNAYDDLGKYDVAWEYYQKSLAVSEEVLGHEAPDMAILRANIADFLLKKGDIAISLDYYKQALAIAEKHINIGKQHVANIYSGMGNVYSELGDSDTALAYYQQAMQITQGTLGKNHPAVVSHYGNLAQSLWARGEYVSALNYWAACLPVIFAQQLYNTHSALILLDLGTAFSDFGKGGRLEDAMSHKEIEESFNEMAATFNEKSMITGIKEFYPEYTGVQEPTDFSLLVEHLALLMVDKAGIQEHSVIAHIYNGMGITYSRRGDLTRSLEYYQKALAMSKKVRGDGDGSLYYNIATCYYDQHDIKAAIANWEKAYACFKNEKNYTTILSDVKQILSYSDITDAKFLQQTIDVGLSTVEQARLTAGAKKTNAMQQALPIYYYAVQFAKKQGDDKKAFEYSEAMRSRSFLEQLGTEAALQLSGITPSEREKIRALNKKIDIASKRIAEQQELPLADRNAAMLTSYSKDLSDAEKQLAQVDAIIAKRVPKYGQLRNPTVITTKDAQKSCESDRAYLEYVLWSPEYGDGAEHNSYCIVLTKKDVQVVPLNPTYDYTAAVNVLRQGITHLDSEDLFEEPRNALYENLISPVLPLLGGKKELVIVPDGVLSFLPFDVLRKDAASKDFGEAYSIVLSPSVSISALLGGSDTSIKQIAAFGGAWYDQSFSSEEHREVLSGNTDGIDRGIVAVKTNTATNNAAQIEHLRAEILQHGPGAYFAEQKLNWQDLPGTVTELQILQNSVFTKGQLTSYMQEDAIESNIKKISQSGQLAKYPVLHFACHGYFDTTIAEMSSILFSEVSGQFSAVSNEDGYLTVPEVSALNLNADMVCLSACETGLGEIKAGDGMVGLSRAFMVAGARHVGVSLWNVSDEATAAFMAQMYKKCQDEKLSYVEAYRAVKAEFRKNGTWAHPYYWAAFSLYGGGTETGAKQKAIAKNQDDGIYDALRLGDEAYERKDYGAAYKHYSAAAKKGNPVAQNKVGELYFFGQGVKKNYKKSVSYIQKAVEQYDADAQSNLGYCYVEGIVVPQDYKKALELYTQSADQNNANGYYGLGLLYLNGQGVEANFFKTFDYWKTSAELGNANAQNGLASLYFNGLGTNQSYADAFTWYEKAAAQNDSWGQYYLANMYAQGTGVSQDYAKAKTLYEKAAEQENSAAQKALGDMYKDASGVVRDYRTALAWYQKAAAQENAGAQSQIGLFYALGYGGLKKDYATARTWYEKAAAQGDADAQNELGALYGNGRGVAQDYAKARGWYEKAAVQGHAMAQYNLGLYYANGRGVAQDYAKAREWYEKAAAQGDADAQNNLGSLYGNGQGVAQDYTKAFEWYEKAAVQGHAMAQYNLGLYYANGYGVAQDYAKAREWYEKAAAQGDASAQNNLGVLYENGRGVSQDIAQAKAWYEKAAAQGLQTAKNNVARLNRQNTQTKTTTTTTTKAPTTTTATRSNNWLFPLYGIDLGKTTVSQLRAKGTKDKEYALYKINGQNFWYDDNVFTHMYITHYDWIPEWKAAGYDASLSYNEWISFLKSQGYAITVKTAPHTKKWDGKDSLTAEVVARRTYPVKHKLTLGFSYSGHPSVTDKNTLYSFGVTTQFYDYD